jgi:hypothetical protein
MPAAHSTRTDWSPQLKGTGKNANFTAEEALRADIKADVKSRQVQILLWLSGIVLASNGMVIALLARLAGAI